MALEFAKGWFQWATSDAVSATKTVSGLSFQPVAIRFYFLSNGNAANAVGAQHITKSVGFAISTSSRRCVAAMSRSGQAAADCGSMARDDCVMATMTTGGTANGRLDLNAINSDGFQCIVDAATTEAVVGVHWEAWGGSDITVAVVGDITEPAATGNVDYTVTGFTSGATDQVVMLAGVQSVSALNTAENQDSGFHVGFAASTTAADNVTVVGNSDDASATMDTDGYCQDGECLSMITIAGGNPNARATLTTFGTDNFRLNWAARATTGRRSIFLAIKGGRWKSGALTINGNTGSATATVSGLAFAPIGISLVGRMTAEDTSATATANDRMSIGSGTSTSDRQANGMLDEDATANSETEGIVRNDAVLAYPSTAAGVQSLYDINAMNSDGFQLIVDTAGGVASEFIGYLTFGSAPITKSLLWNPYIFIPHLVRRVREWLEPFRQIKPRRPVFTRAANESIFNIFKKAA